MCELNCWNLYTKQRSSNWRNKKTYRFKIMEENYNEDILKQIQDEIESLRKEFGIEDTESQEDLNNTFGIDFGSLQDQLDVMSKTKNIQIELLNEDAIFPEYAYLTDSGFDLYSTEEVKLSPFGRALVPTGLKLSFDIC